jgi:tetratricopeptide (TPR) repeat protein
VSDCLERKDYEAAMRYADRLVQLEGTRIDGYAYYYRARVWAHQSNLEGAVRDLSIAIDSSESEYRRAMFLVARGRCHQENGQHDRAARDYTEAYRYRLLECRQQNSRETRDLNLCNYMGIIDFFWNARHTADTRFGFELLQYDRGNSHREDKTARWAAVAEWLIDYVDVHPAIMENVSNVDAKVYSLYEEGDPSRAGGG